MGNLLLRFMFIIGFTEFVILSVHNSGFRTVSKDMCGVLFRGVIWRYLSQHEGILYIALLYT